jgi:hypothetical protein
MARNIQQYVAERIYELIKNDEIWLVYSTDIYCDKNFHIIDVKYSKSKARAVALEHALDYKEIMSRSETSEPDITEDTDDNYFIVEPGMHDSKKFCFKKIK